MKRVLIICYYWPPAGGSAVQRWLRFVRHLPGTGWMPTVYTAENGEYPVLDPALERLVPKNVEVLRRPIWEPYALYRRSLAGGAADVKVHPGFLDEKNSVPNWKKGLGRWIRGNFFVPDARRFWIRPSVRYLTDHLRSSPVDVIISSGPPHSLHLIAHALHKRTSIPWIADFRDPWTTMDYYRELHLTRWADRRHHRLEERVVKEASAVVVVGPVMKKEFEDKYGRHVDVITNGFDTTEAALGAVALDPKFTLVHVGGLLKNRNPYSLWKALGELVRNEP
ncbi:MAG TPA: glycosyltransferase, partial [Flavobacteriales bacterium]|nr:glycosyltransferase [Flavobacteriales bacterium]